VFLCLLVFSGLIVNVYSTSWISSKYANSSLGSSYFLTWLERYRLHLARATSSLGSSKIHSNWLELNPHLARAKLIQSESEVRYAPDMEEERFMEDLVSARTAL
jgi:hypothetical protein